MVSSGTLSWTNIWAMFSEYPGCKVVVDLRVVVADARRDGGDVWRADEHFFHSRCYPVCFVEVRAGRRFDIHQEHWLF